MIEFPGPTKTIDLNEDYAKSLIEHGQKCIKLGNALLNRKTRITKLVELAHDLGFKLVVDISTPTEDSSDGNHNT